MNEPTNNLPPHNQDTEEAALGSMLIDPDSILFVRDWLSPDDFYLGRNRAVCQALFDLFDGNEPIDYMIVQSRLERNGSEVDIGYLASLITAVPTSINIRQYCRYVSELSTRRKMIQAAQQVAKLAYDRESDIDCQMDEAEKLMMEIRKARTGDIGLSSVYAREYLDEITRRSEMDTPLVGPTTSIPALDDLIGGFEPAQLHIIAARPKMGKSALLMQSARVNAERGKRALYFSLEMTKNQLMSRNVAALTGLPTPRLRVGKIYPEEKKALYEAIGHLSTIPLFIDDTKALTPAQISAKARRVWAEYGLDLIMIDYIGLMAPGYRVPGNRNAEITEISSSLVKLAGDLNVPVVVASQLNRSVEQRSDKRPMLSDLRDSGCLSGNTLVTLSSGERKKIKDLPTDGGFDVLSLNTNTWKIESSAVSRAVCNGKKQLYTLQTQLGREIEATGNHKFLTIDGWKRLDELVIGEHVAVPRCVEPVRKQDSINWREAALLGYLIGDGCTLKRHAIQFTTKDLDTGEDVTELVENIFGGDVDARICRERTWYQVYLSSVEKHTKNSPIRLWLEMFDVFDKRATEKTVPDSVFSQSHEVRRSFLRTLWSTDGSVFMSKTSKSLRPTISYSTSSKDLAFGVQSLLLTFGINARVNRVSYKNSDNPGYHVVVTGKPEVLKFINTIGIAGTRKQAKMSEIMKWYSSREGNTNRDVIPSSVWQSHILPYAKTKGWSHRQLASAMGVAYNGTARYKNNLSREHAENIAQLVASEYLKKLAVSDVYWDKVSSVTESRIDFVYDLTVPDNHNFIAGNIIAHNSLEQDAYTVTFIYRDDYYNPVSSMTPGLAELIVAANRGGAAGVVNAAWDGERTSFSDKSVVRITL